MPADVIVSAAHLWFAILATFRLTELVTMDRVAAPLRARFPHYLWTCGRCVSVWAGIATTLVFVSAPWLNWPLGLSWLLIVRWDWAAAARAWREYLAERAVTRALRPIAGGSVGPPPVATQFISRASNGSASDVQAKIDQSTTGDIVTIPPGDFTWNSQTVVLSTNCTLQGAGIGVTRIFSAGSMTTLLWVNAPGVSRVTGITFISQVTNSQSSEAGAVVLTSTTPTGTPRLDHCEIINNLGRNHTGLVVQRNIGGLADHNTFTHQGPSSAMVGVFDHDTGNTHGDESWAAPDDMGAAGNGITRTFYFEDNTFNNNSFKVELNGPEFGMTDGQRGGRAVYRKNRFNDFSIGEHGTDTTGRDRSMRLIEAYDNDIYWTRVGDPASQIQRRGGAGVAFNNRIHMRNGIQIKAFYLPVNFRSIADYGSGAFGVPPFYPCGMIQITSLTNNGLTATATTAGAHQLRGTYASSTYTGNFVRVSGAAAAAFNGNFKVDSITSNTFTYTMASTPSGPSNCGGAATCFQSNPFDQNSGTDGYKCLDQVGTGQCDLISDNTSPQPPPPWSPSVQPQPVQWPNQQLSPHYCWNNTYDLVDNGPTTPLNCGGGGSTIVATRDVINGVKPGYQPYPYPHPLTGGGGGGPIERGPIAGVPGAYAYSGAVPLLQRIANLVRLRYRRP